MLYILIFLAGLFSLFILSRLLTKELSKFFLRFVKSRKFVVYILSFLFLPGTFIHEFSHLMTAVMLRVSVSDMEFIPKIQGNSVRLGSVSIAKTNPFSRFIIGIAPFVIGVFIILAVLSYKDFSYSFKDLFSILIFYFVFQVGNTMFSSKKDMEGALELCLAVLILGGIFYLIGFRIPSSFWEFIFNNSSINSIFQRSVFLLLIPIAIDAVLILLTKVLNYVFG